MWGEPSFFLYTLFLLRLDISALKVFLPRHRMWTPQPESLLLFIGLSKAYDRMEGGTENVEHLDMIPLS